MGPFTLAEPPHTFLAVSRTAVRLGWRCGTGTGVPEQTASALHASDLARPPAGGDHVEAPPARRAALLSRRARVLSLTPATAAPSPSAPARAAGTGPFSA